MKKNKDDSNATQIEDVIVISFGNDVECPGMLSEQKVLSWEQENKRRKVTYHEGISNYVSSAEPGEKRTRFSLSQDQESIGKFYSMTISIGKFYSMTISICKFYSVTISIGKFYSVTINR